MRCDNPFFVELKNPLYQERVPVPCGKCPACKQRRVNQWVFRLLEQDKVSTSAHFVTLTYDTRFVPISDNGFMTLRKSDFQDYMKRLRKLCPDSKLKYFVAGEYGSQNKRPHYHAIIFNVPDAQMLFDAWSLNGVNFGTVHIGTVTGDSIAYTMKYIDKSQFRVMHGRDDRVAEFQLQSKGLGESYLSESCVAYHKSDVSRLYVTKLSGHKVSMPRYYRNKIFSKAELEQQVGVIQAAVAKADQDARLQFERERLPGRAWDFEQNADSARLERYRKFYHSSKQKREL